MGSMRFRGYMKNLRRPLSLIMLIRPELEQYIKERRVEE